MRRVAVVVSLVSMLGCGGTKDVCAGVDCGVGVCVLADGAAACLCPSGFEADGASCRALPPVDLCASDPCAALSQSLCLVHTGVVRCECPSTRVEVAGACVVRTPCLPSPCTRPRRTTCVVEGDAARCVCEPGYAVEGDGCSATPVWSCDAPHVDGDAAEPDECPTLAKPLALDDDEARTLSPAGDHDWVRLGVTRGSVFTVTASSPTLPLLVEVFDRAGTEVLAADNRGATVAEVSFVAPGDEVLLRVRSVRANVTGDYTVRYREVGPDDYVDGPGGALTLLPTAPFVGDVQYPGDLDVVWLELPAATAVRLTVPDAGTPGVVFALSRPDGGTRVLSPGDTTFVTVPAVEALVLTARGATARDQGAFRLELGVRGPDDFSDDPAFALPVTLGAVVSGEVSAGDFDSMRLEQARERVYAWVPLTTATEQLDVAVFGAMGQVLGRSTWATPSGVVWKAVDSLPVTLRVGDSWGSTSAQPWAFRVEDRGLDDHADTLDAATPLVGSAGGRLEYAGDVDTFSFTAQAGHVVQVRSSSGGLSLTMFDPQDQQLAQGVGAVASVAATTGTWRVQVRAGSSSGTAAPYTLTVSDLGVDDFGATHGTVTLGAGGSGDLQWATDVDVFDFVPTAGHLYAVSATRVAGGAFGVRVRDPAGAQVSSSFLASVAGTWQVEVFAEASQQPGSYTVSVVDLGEDHGATQATATALTPGVATPGVIGFATDVDVFSFAVAQGRIYAVTSSSSAARVELRDSQYGFVGSETSVSAASNGTMYALVTAASASVPLSYTLMVRDLGPDDHGDTAATATRVSIGTHVPGITQFSGDVDVLAVTPTTGHHTRAVCSGASACSLVVRDVADTVLASGSSSVDFKAPPGATVYLSVESSTVPLSWSLHLSDVGLDDHGEGVSDATALVLDAGVAGVLEVASDVDAFRVAAAQGQIVQVTVQGVGFAPTVQLSSPAGSLVAQSTGSTVTIGFRASAAGEWMTRVSAPSSAPSPLSYTVVARSVVDDFPTATTVSPGQLVAGALDYVGDTDVLLLPLTAGTPGSLTLSGNVRANVSDGAGNWVTTLSPGSRSFTPGTSDTYRVEIVFDSGADLVPAWTFVAQ